MTMEGFKAIAQAAPFQPFILHLSDRRELEVNHPDFVLFSGDPRTAMVAQPDESFLVIDLSTIASLEFKGAASKS